MFGTTVLCRNCDQQSASIYSPFACDSNEQWVLIGAKTFIICKALGTVANLVGHLGAYSKFHLPYQSLQSWPTLMPWKLDLLLDIASSVMSTAGACKSDSQVQPFSKHDFDFPLQAQRSRDSRGLQRENAKQLTSKLPTRTGARLKIWKKHWVL